MKAFLIALFFAIVVVVLVGFISRSSANKEVVARVAGRVDASGLLADERFRDVKIQYDHLTARVSGMVSSESERDALFRSLSSAMGAGRVDGSVEIVPPTVPSILIQREGTDLTISGEVKDRSPFESLMTSPKGQFGVEKVNDELTVRSRVLEVPKAEQLSEIARALVGATSNSLLGLSDGVIRVEGQLNSPAAKDALVGQINAFADGSYRFEDGLTVAPPSPASFSLAAAPEGGYVVSGVLPTVESRATILAALPTGPKVNSDGLLVGENVELPTWLEGLPKFLQTPAALVSAPHFSLSREGLLLSGTVSSEEAKQEISSALAGLSSGLAPKIELEVVVPRTRPMEFSFSSSGKEGVVVEGRLPDESSLNALRSGFAGATVPVIDRLTVDPATMTAAWMAAVPQLLKNLLPEIKNGATVILKDGKLTVSGELLSAEARARVLSGLSPLQDAGIEILDQLTVKAPSPTIPPTLALKRREGEVIVSGTVGSDAQKTLILDAVKAGNPPPVKVLDLLKIDDQVMVLDGGRTLPAVLQSLSGGAATYELSAKQLVLQGEMATQAMKENLLALATPFSKAGYRIVDKLTVRPVPVPVLKVESKPVPMPVPKSEPKPLAKVEPMKVPAIPTGVEPASVPSVKAQKSADKRPELTHFDSFTLYYDSGAYGIRDSERDSFDRIVEAAKKSDQPILIDGYADGQGTQFVNEFVSRMRAEKLTQYLVEHGIDASRIHSASGHGSVGRGGNEQESRRSEIRIGK